MRGPPLHDLSPDEVGRVCLVTGGAGYLGRHLVRALLDLGCEVRVLDRAPITEPGVTAFQGDLADAALLQAACAGVDTVFHAAAVITLLGVARQAVRERVFRINVDGTRQVIHACQASGVGRLVYTSSANVVIDRELVEVDESVPYASAWVDLYGESKAEAERLVRAANSPALRTVALRPGGIWGPGGGGFMIDAFLRQLAERRFVATIGDGAAVVDNTHVYSLVRAELLAARALRHTPERVGGQAYFITDDERINGIAWFRPLVEALGEPWPSRALPGRAMYLLAWSLEWAHYLGAPEPPLTRIGIAKLIRSSAFRIDRARDDLGYAPLIDHRAGLRLHHADYEASFRALRGAPYPPDAR